MKNLLQSIKLKFNILIIKLKIYKLIIKKIINKAEGIKVIILLFVFFLTIKTNLILSYIIIFYLFINLYFIYFLYNLKYKKNLNHIKYQSIIKDKEYLLFKDSLFKFYFSGFMILFFYLFKVNGFNNLLDLNTNFILLLLFIILFYSILINNLFTLKLFNIYNKIKYYIQLLNEINLDSYNHLPNNNKIKLNKINLNRNYSTNSGNLDNIEESNSDDLNISYEKASELKDFHSNFDV